MKKLSILVFTFLFLTGCYQSMALLGPATGAANGKVVQSSLQSASSYGIKKQTGKSPFEHVLAYTEQKDLENCQKENAQTKKCLNLNEKLLSAQSLVEQKDQIITEIKTESKEVIQEKAKSARELAISVQAAIIEKSKIKYLD
jgi:superfamily II DNA helicase RecQ